MTEHVRDRGTATVVVAAMLSVIVVVASVLGMAASAYAEAVRAQGVADIAALAAASVARDLRALGVSGSESPCERATLVVTANALTLRDCAVHADGSVSVWVVSGQPVLTVTRAARAGSGRFRAKKRPGSGAS